MNSLHSQIHHQFSPFSPTLRHILHLMPGVFGKIDKCLFNKPTNHSWISTTTWYSSWLLSMLSNISKQTFPQCIVASFWELDFLIRVKAFPLFFDSVNIEHSFCLAILNYFWRRSSNRNINTKANFPCEYFIQNLSKILLCEP
jgi:hypothetical protein